MVVLIVYAVDSAQGKEMTNEPLAATAAQANLRVSRLPQEIEE